MYLDTERIVDRVVIISSAAYNEKFSNPCRLKDLEVQRCEGLERNTEKKKKKSELTQLRYLNKLNYEQSNRQFNTLIYHSEYPRASDVAVLRNNSSADGG